jgi:membrane dipeptidase
MLIVDSHEDLAWNIKTFRRDYTLSAAEIRRNEIGSEIPSLNDDTLLGWPDYQRGQVAVVFSTLFAAPARTQEGVWDTQYYATPGQAHDLYSAQLDVYHRLVDENPDKFRLIREQSELKALLSNWEEGSTNERPVGLVVLMEGAEGVRDPDELEEWWARGVRLIGPAWTGTRFCGGTREPGPLTSEGYALLEGMAEIGFCLDLSHMDEKAALQALDAYPGSIIASHANPLSMLKESDSNRHLSDRVIHLLIERGGVIGVVPYNAFLKATWKRGDRREDVTLHNVVAHIDYICQRAGDARHVGLGSDFDGGFGLQSVPVEIDTIADLQKLAPLLAEKGYSDTDIAAIFGQNWLNCLKQILPESA